LKKKKRKKKRTEEKTRELRRQEEVLSDGRKEISKPCSRGKESAMWGRNEHMTTQGNGKEALMVHRQKKKNQDAACARGRGNK